MWVEKMLSSSSATNGFIPCSSSSSSSKSKKRVFFLDVNPLCYEGSKPSLKCFGKWLSLFLSPQVTHTHPVVAVIDGERGSQHRRNLIPSYKANRCSSTSFSISTSPGHVGRFQPLITRVLHKCNVPVCYPFSFSFSHYVNCISSYSHHHFFASHPTLNAITDMSHYSNIHCFSFILRLLGYSLFYSWCIIWRIL